MPVKRNKTFRRSRLSLFQDFLDNEIAIIVLQVNNIFVCNFRRTMVYNIFTVIIRAIFLNMKVV